VIVFLLVSRECSLTHMDQCGISWMDMMSSLLKSKDGDGVVNLGRTRECCSSGDSVHLSNVIYGETAQYVDPARP